MCDFNRMSTTELDNILAAIEVGEVWGVGRKTAPKLQEIGIHSVLDLKRAPAKRLSARFSIVFERIVEELNGVACLDLGDVAPAKQQITCSRSFGTLTSSLPDLEQALISYTTRATEKLRQQRSMAGGIHVYIRTNPHKEGEQQYEQSLLMPLAEPTDDTRLFCRAALHGLRQIYRSWLRLPKARRHAHPTHSRLQTARHAVRRHRCPEQIACADDGAGSHQSHDGQRYGQIVG